MLFISNNASGEGAWAPAGNDPMPAGGSIGDDLYLESLEIFLQSVDTITVSDPSVNWTS